MNAVLLLIDLQEDFLRGNRDLAPPREVLVLHVSKLLEEFRHRRLPVLHVWTTIEPGRKHRFPHWPKDASKCREGTPGHRPPNCLQPRPGERIIHKQGFNPFADGQLEGALAEVRPALVLLAGVHLHACVRTAAVECMERGYSVLLAEGAVGTDDPVHGAAVRRWLARRCARLLSASDCLRVLSGNEPCGYVHISPRGTGEACFELSDSSPVVLEQSVMRAVRAKCDWSARPLGARLNALAGIPALLRANAVSLAHQMAVEIGKPIAHGLEEIERAARNVEDVLHRAPRAMDQTDPSQTVRRRPLGVVAMVTPWNNPIAISLGKLVPALAYGNAIVWKPAPSATGLARKTMKLLHRAGLPPGLVATLEGGAQTARDLAEADGVDAVTLTGSEAAGFAMQEICARRGIPLQAELGGNNAAIVWDPANREEAARQIAWGGLAFAGQRCTANRRVILPEQDVEQCFEALARAAGALVWGDPLDPKTDIGPVVTREWRETLEAFMALAESERSLSTRVQPHAQPALPEDLDHGAYAPPWLLVCSRPDHALVREEWMAPLLVVQAARDFDHALALSNGVRQGLAAALFTQSRALGEKFLEHAQAGILKLNASTAGVDPAMPFGGWKASGVGPPEHGEGDRLFYLRFQSVYGLPS